MGSVVTAVGTQGELDFPMPFGANLWKPAPSRSRTPAPAIRIAGRVLNPTAVFDTYWCFASKRQAVYQARVAGNSGPWTDDPVLLRHRFTNCYRASDRVSQYLIREVSYTGSQRLDEVVFRTLLFKMFNRVSTWQLLVDALGDLSWKRYNFVDYNEVLSAAFDGCRKLYSAAYVVPPPRLGGHRKHTNHLRLLELMMTSGIVEGIAGADSLQRIFNVLKSYPAMGDFLAYQFAIDLNYSAVIDFNEMEFVVPGPGAKDGIRKCFGPVSDGIEAELIRYMAEHQEEHFARLGLEFTGLRGRPLQLIDCQNLFCEVDKYARVVHPDIIGHSGRSRIKQLFAPVPEPVTAWFPPKWRLRP